jgi:hypothetical protein
MATNSDRLKKGSRPPYLSLADAFVMVTAIYEQGGGRASKDLMSRVTKNSTSSSSFQRKIAALKGYGLLAEENDAFVLTDIATGIAAPTSPQGASDAKEKAFLSIEVFSKIFERHKGKLLPADEFLNNIIEQDLAIPKDVSREWVAAIKDSLKAAGFLYDRGDGKVQIMESPITRYPRSKPDASIPLLEQTVPSDGQTKVPSSPSEVRTDESGHNTKIALSGQRYAVFSIPDGLTARDAQKIKSAIEGIKTIVESLVETEPSS